MPILMHLDMMLAYLMLLAYFNFFILPMTFALLLSTQMLFVFMLCLWIIDTACLLRLLVCIMHCAFS